MLNRIGTALAIVGLCVIAILRVSRPPAPVPGTAPDTVFSAERAMRHVEEIAVRPHAIGMADHDRVRDYIVAQLGALGLRAQLQTTTAVATRNRADGHVQNILTWLPGNGSKGKAVLLVAHYDGVEAGPAAADDGAGCAALLETLRALRASRTPLAHDIFVLFSDGEEAGLLGAAAFVREHPWARDVGIALNFEARGTAGRSFMFETGPGNLDAARVLRTAPDVTAGSVFTAVYRALPNDTDLSELALLDVPALNFAFIDGVERYHTSHDDVAHLDPGSLQHHGMQMLALARTLANGPMPRPVTGDAAFFDFPVLGLVVYPVGLALPLAIVATLLVIVLVVRERTAGASIAIGVGVALLAVVASIVVGLVASRLLRGPAAWSGLYAIVISLVVIAITLACWSVAGRWATIRGLHLGALLIWAVLSLVTAALVPGASYLFVWPLLAAAGAAFATRYREIAEWGATIVTLLLLAGLTAAVSVIALGLAGPGAMILALFTSLITLLLGPALVRIAGAARAFGAPWLLGAAIVMLVVALVRVHPNDAHPTPTAIAYAEGDDSTAWLGSIAGGSDAWARSVVGDVRSSPPWTRALLAGGNRFGGHAVSRVSLPAPVATLVRDTAINGLRRVVLRITAPVGTTETLVRVTGAPVVRYAIDDRVADTTRFRRAGGDWTESLWAVPESGVVMALSIPLGARITVQLVARRPGLPGIQGVTIPVRPASVAAVQMGDASYVERHWNF